MHYFTKSELKILEDVLSLPTTSFHEQFIQEYVLHFLKKLELDIKTDVFGNILVHYEKGNTEKPVVFTAHMDHPGFSIIQVLLLCGRVIASFHNLKPLFST